MSFHTCEISLIFSISTFFFWNGINIQLYWKILFQLLKLAIDPSHFSFWSTWVTITECCVSREFSIAWARISANTESATGSAVCSARNMYHKHSRRKSLRPTHFSGTSKGKGLHEQQIKRKLEYRSEVTALSPAFFYRSNQYFGWRHTKSAFRSSYSSQSLKFWKGGKQHLVQKLSHLVEIKFSSLLKDLFIKQ